MTTLHYKVFIYAFMLNLEQVANLRRARVNSASCPSRDGKWVVAYELRGEGLMWLIRAVVCLCAASRVQMFVSAGNGWPRAAREASVLLALANQLPLPRL